MNLNNSISKHSTNVEVVVIGSIILTSLLTQSELLPAQVAWLLVLIAYTPIIVLIIRYNYAIQAPRWSLYAILPIFFIYIINFLISVILSVSVSIEALIRIPIYIPFLILNLWMIPSIVDVRRFFALISTVSTAVVLIGIPTLYSDYRILLFQVTSRGTINVFGVELPRLVSIFDNPNAAGFLFSIGFFASILWYFANRKRIFIIFSIFNIFGVYMAKSRAAYLGVFIAAVALVFHHRFSERQTRVAVLFGLVGSAIGVTMVAGLLPELSVINSVDFSGRDELWRAAIPVILDRPLIGYGAVSTGPLLDASRPGGIHNGYLRQFIHTGIIGGTMYVLIVILIVINSVPKRDTINESMVFAAVIAISVNEIFNGNTIFGISNGSTLTAIIYGYAITHFGET